MPRPAHYKYGDAITPEEFGAVRARITSNKSAVFAPARFLAVLNAIAPLRLEHEVDRLRGLAFDSGEAGFSHTVVEG